MKNSEPIGLDTFDHVVVLMLENRSFDNLLGNLYQGGVPDNKQFAGLQNYIPPQPVPTYALDYEQHKNISPLPAQDFHQPYPDPGEPYQHVNTQLYNAISDGNKSTKACAMTSPYNIPTPTPSPPPMSGFVKDYINVLSAENKSGITNLEPSYKQYSKIMQCYSNEQVSVLSTLAKEFAVFDHWHCSVPSQTWCNRAFWHAAASGGKVINPTNECTTKEDLKDYKKWREAVWSQPNVFQRMQDKKVTHKVFSRLFVSLTSLINGFFESEHSEYMDKDLGAFKRHLNEGRLPQYSFMEPQFLGQHNDQHPSSAKPNPDDGPTKVGTVLLGEALIWDVYNAIFTNDKYKDNTLLIITHDEHGGCFDHVAPPAGKENGVYPPKENVIGEKGFDFKRLGVRVPMVMVSAYIQPNTIMNEQFDHSSFIKTMSDKWDLKPLTQRDAHSNSFKDVFSGPKRSFPNIMAPLIPVTDESEYDNHPLNDLQSSIVKGTAFYIKTRMEDIDGLDIEPPSLKNINTNKDAQDYMKEAQAFLEAIEKDS